MPDDNSHSGLDPAGLPEYLRPRKRPAQERSQQTVDAILAALARILVEHDTFTTNQVAELAGVSIGSLYQYYPNKDSIVAALLQRHAEAEAAFVLERLSALQPRSLREALGGVIDAVFAFRAQAPKLHAALLEQMDRIPQFPALTGSARRAASGFSELLRAFRSEIRDGDLDTMLHVAANATFSLTHRGVLPRPPELDDAALREQIVELLLGYLAPHCS